MNGRQASAELSGAAVVVINTTNKTGALMLRESFLLKMFCVCIAFSTASCTVGLSVAELCVSGNSSPWLQSNGATGI